MNQDRDRSTLSSSPNSPERGSNKPNDLKTLMPKLSDRSGSSLIMFEVDAALYTGTYKRKSCVHTKMYIHM